MKILDIVKFKDQLEWFDSLKKAGGWISEDIISHCDRWRLANSPKGKGDIKSWDATISFIVKILKDFSINVDDELKGRIESHFLSTTQNYYSIKDYLLKLIEEAKTELDQFQNKKLPEAACVMVLSSLGELLMVTRKNGEKLGIPGGKVDFGETPIEAAVREFKEETGYNVKLEELELVYAMVVNGYFCWGYVFVDPKTRRPLTINKDKFQVKEVEPGIIPQFVDIRTIPEVSEFIDYNCSMLQSIMEYDKIFIKDKEVV